MNPHRVNEHVAVLHRDTVLRLAPLMRQAAVSKPRVCLGAPRTTTVALTCYKVIDASAQVFNY
jgi:hypothetical protein